MASTSIQRSRTAGSTKTKFTISMWVKKSANNAKYLMVNRTDDSNRGLFQFGGSDELLFQSKYSASNNATLQTNRKFRDTSGWYHFVLVGDSTLSTAADRTKLYVNGVRETSFATEVQIPSGEHYYINEATTNGFRIGEKGDGSDYFDGLMSHVHFTDGYAYQASTFGSTDSTTGEWKINTSPSVTYGTNGFFLKMEDSSNMDLDSSSNNLSFSTNGTLTKTEDCPSNVFCTMNPLDKYAVALTNGNTTATCENNASTGVMSTLAVNSGKWYWEAKVGDSASDTLNVGVRKTGQNNYNVTGFPYSANGWVYAVDGNIYHNGSTLLNTGTTCTVGDIIGFILDMDAGTLKLKKNGSDIYSGNAVITGLNTGEHFHVVQGSSQSLVYFNFGNGYFGTTAVSSAGTNASGNGIFEYDVPANHTAISTKGYNL